MEAHDVSTIVKSAKYDGSEFSSSSSLCSHPAPTASEAGPSPAKKSKKRKYDLKAVNPNAKNNEDTRTPEQLLDLIEAKGREVAEPLAVLRVSGSTKSSLRLCRR
jgi:hypothetical protein